MFVSHDLLLRFLLYFYQYIAGLFLLVTIILPFIRLTFTLTIAIMRENGQRNSLIIETKVTLDQ